MTGSGPYSPSSMTESAPITILVFTFPTATISPVASINLSESAMSKSSVLTDIIELGCISIELIIFALIVYDPAESVSFVGSNAVTDPAFMVMIPPLDSYCRFLNSVPTDSEYVNSLTPFLSVIRTDLSPLNDTVAMLTRLSCMINEMSLHKKERGCISLFPLII